MENWCGYSLPVEVCTAFSCWYFVSRQNMKMLKVSTISLETVSEENFSRQKDEKSQGKSDSCCNVPFLDDHQNPEATLPTGYRKVSTNTLKMHPTEHYLWLLHFSDSVQLHCPERGHLQTTGFCLMTSIICCSLSRNTPGTTQLKQQSAVNYFTDHMNRVKTHCHCWFSQEGSHEIWTCPPPSSGQRFVPLDSGLDELCLWLWSRHLWLRNVWSSSNPLSGIHSWNTGTLHWLCDRGGKQFVVSHKVLAGT